MWRCRARILTVILAAGLAAGCSSATALKNAKSSFEQAKAAGAEKKAPYEYYMAESYLGVAEHASEEGDRDGVREFAEKSGQFSAEAITKAGGGAK